ncbi:hypothetical protein GQ53DRAFT_747464 [Thozetella sp. PMI_491]|nr:hypothetical protein GQ53DRAFT_747464 [Thozetella sp. PMI_491]
MLKLQCSKPGFGGLGGLSLLPALNLKWPVVLTNDAKVAVLAARGGGSGQLTNFRAAWIAVVSRFLCRQRCIYVKSTFVSPTDTG